jgi:hypothetical protein
VAFESDRQFFLGKLQTAQQGIKDGIGHRFVPKSQQPTANSNPIAISASVPKSTPTITPTAAQTLVRNVMRLVRP